MEEIDFQIFLTDNYYINPNSIHICFPINIKRKTNKDVDLDGDLITVNNFFAYFVNEISVKMYGNDKELIPTFSPYEIYNYSDGMVKHFPKDTLKKLRKHCFTVIRLFILTMLTLIEEIGMNATEIATLKKTMQRT